MAFSATTFVVLALGLVHLSSVSAQSAPSVVSGNWTLVGCYTDTSVARTLAATSTTGDSMTVELCTSFCDKGGYIFSGVEFGNCDSTIQVPSQPTALSDCNFGCSGNSSEICGSSGKLNVYTNGKPAPVIPKSLFNNVWTYQGCFTDSTSARTLHVPVNIPGGVTPDSCTAACQALGNFTFAGVETGRECWCDNAVNTPAQRVSDNDCRMVCDSNHSEYCGNTNRVATYRFSASGIPQGPQPCLSTNTNNFTLRAEYRNDPSVTVGLKVIVVEMVRGATWTLLTACPNCCSEWLSFSLQNSIIFPKSVVVPGELMSSTAPGDGESPNFVASNPAFPGFQAFCTVEDTTSNPGSPSILAFGNKADAFSLCKNQTANGRLDIVYSPVTGHPNYLLSDCDPVNIQVITGA